MDHYAIHQIYKTFMITSVYAKYTMQERTDLWEALEDYSLRHVPWFVGGGFNVILNEKEKLRGEGLDFTQQEPVDFAQCISQCGISELTFSWSNFTWWNGQMDEACVFKRLDRVLVNAKF